MMLTGFDAKVLNTLYVDKKFRISQSTTSLFSYQSCRTYYKTIWQYRCYRNLKTKTDDAIRLFSQTSNIDDVLVKKL